MIHEFDMHFSHSSGASIEIPFAIEYTLTDYYPETRETPAEPASVEFVRILDIYIENGKTSYKPSEFVEYFTDEMLDDIAEDILNANP